MALRREPAIDGVAVLRLDRPERRNALDTPLIEALTAALDELSRDDELRALVLSTTDSGAFCAGADVTEPLSDAQGVARMRAFAALYAALEAFPLPVIAVCVGDTLGAGAELAIGSDLRVAGDNLRLAWVGARLGVPVGVARLVPLVGLGRAKELILTGRRLGMAEAAELGLVHRTATAAGAEAAALALAAEVAALPADGLRRIKTLFRELEGTAGRVARENAELVAWQQHGAGLPQGRR